jgi:hypothetical protein
MPEPQETPIARQRLSKQVFAATDTQATIEEFLGTMLSVRSVQNGNKGRELVNWGSNVSLNLAVAKLTTVQVTKLPL